MQIDDRCIPQCGQDLRSVIPWFHGGYSTSERLIFDHEFQRWEERPRSEMETMLTALVPRSGAVAIRKDRMEGNPDVSGLEGWLTGDPRSPRCGNLGLWDVAPLGLTRSATLGVAAASQMRKALETSPRHNVRTCCGSQTALRQSQRDCGLQPKVARNELPWVTMRNWIQPQRGCGKPIEGGVSIPNVLLVPFD